MRFSVELLKTTLLPESQLPAGGGKKAGKRTASRINWGGTMSWNRLSTVSVLRSAYRRGLARWHYNRALVRGRGAGEIDYIFKTWVTPDPPLVELRLRTDGPQAVAASSASLFARQ